jgi:hypothetical protein
VYPADKTKPKEKRIISKNDILPLVNVPTIQCFLIKALVKGSPSKFSLATQKIMAFPGPIKPFTRASLCLPQFIIIIVPAVINKRALNKA